jgi:alpha-galactosidase
MKSVMIATVLGLMPGVTSQAAAKPLKVFILAGQSNMQGWFGVSTLDSMADDPKTAPILKELRNADGKPRVCQKVWISSIGCAGGDTTEQKGKLTVGFGAEQDRFGPEFPFGIYMEKLLGEPILIIKTSWGGKSLHTDFRPPGAGPYVWSDYELAQCKRRGDDLEKDKADKVKATGVYYRLMIEHVGKVLGDIKRVVPDYDPSQGYEIAGFVWFQGFNDLVSTWTYPDNNKPGGYDLYAVLLAHFIRDVRKDLNAPKMPFVIGVMGLNGMAPPQGELYFHQAQAAPAALPEFKGNVVAVETAPFWDADLDTLHRRDVKFWSQQDARAAEAAKKNPKLTGAEYQAAKDQVLLENGFTPEEVKRLRRGVSNLGFHYLGAAKIIAPIGKAFAEAMVSFPKTQRQEKQ